MAKEQTKNTAPVGATNATAAPEGWETESTGFPPYWSPEPGKTFRGIVLSRDDSDPEFTRYTLKATAPCACAQGPADDQTDVQVPFGGFFNVSAYAALPLDRYIGFEVFVQAKQQRDLKGGKSIWDFTLMVSPETRKLVGERQAHLLAQANATPL